MKVKKQKCLTSNSPKQFCDKQKILYYPITITPAAEYHYSNGILFNHESERRGSISRTSTPASAAACKVELNISEGR